MIAGGTVEVRLPPHLSVEVNGSYHELQFETEVQFGQTPPDWGRAFQFMGRNWSSPRNKRGTEVEFLIPRRRPKLTLECAIEGYWSSLTS